MRILVVDDDASGRYLASTILKGYGHEVFEAVNGLDALSVARREPVDVVLTDILMPTMDGYALCRAWKSDPDLSKTPLVFYTATYTDPEDETFASTIGADGFITKPQEPERLVQLVAEVAGGEPGTARPAQDADETHVLREYNERLVSKLERKVVEADSANEDLRRAVEVLSEEVGVKNRLIEKLTADVEERRASAEELSRTIQQFNAVLTMSPVPVVLIDPELRVTGLNPAAQELFGSSLGPRDDGAPLDDDERRNLEEMVRGTREISVHKRTRPGRDGTPVEYTVAITATRDAAGSVTGYVTSVLDWKDVPGEA